MARRLVEPGTDNKMQLYTDVTFGPYIDWNGTRIYLSQLAALPAPTPIVVMSEVPPPQPFKIEYTD